MFGAAVCHLYPSFPSLSLFLHLFPPFLPIIPSCTDMADIGLTSSNLVLRSQRSTSASRVCLASMSLRCLRRQRRMLSRFTISLVPFRGLPGGLELLWSEISRLGMAGRKRGEEFQLRHIGIGISPSIFLQTVPRLSCLMRYVLPFLLPRIDPDFALFDA